MKDFKIYLSVASILLIVYLVAEYNKPKPVNWAPTLSYNDKIPFGTYILYNRLNDIFPKAEVAKTNKSAYRIFSDTSLKHGNYLIISKSVNFTKVDFKAMLKYISAGNSVFITALEWDGYLADSLKLESKTQFGKQNTGLNFTNTRLRRPKNYTFDKYISEQYFSELDTAKATVLGINQYGNANFLRYSFGKGNLYLLANPQVLTNYSLLKLEGADYTAKVLSYLPSAKNVYWDQFQNHDIPTDQSPMRVFFEHSSLQWAYYLALFSLLLFVVYEIKRRQRIIPVITPLPNATLEFVTVVGKVYYEQRDNSNIAIKKIVYFAEHLRAVFGLKTGNYNSEFISHFINKTGVESSMAHELFNHINYLQNQSRVTDHELIVLNQLIEKFYIQSGSYGK
jgi:hypothetical protein